MGFFSTFWICLKVAIVVKEVNITLMHQLPRSSIPCFKPQFVQSGELVVDLFYNITNVYFSLIPAIHVKFNSACWTFHLRKYIVPYVVFVHGRWCGCQACAMDWLMTNTLLGTPSQWTWEIVNCQFVFTPQWKSFHGAQLKPKVLWCC